MKYTYTLQDLPKIAEKVLLDASNKILLFYGDMGVGKTTLIKEIAKRLGVIDNISSPTFSIVNEYEIDNDKVFHFDFYRIKNEEEALDIGIEEYFYSDHWSLIEWPEKIENLLPTKSTIIKLIKNENGSRTINIMPVK
ncbi:MAG: tRNA (adenosine(37)-N6)-threonylcarbamoyltransferase complex ATPase subunit type 1 TsaE [Bacteroidetes bacterium]|nr:tRNA (adenosine(37)-N6)-threonylcarbamoyltransferase complex ATPase subunit type 1 TsaE [Bacteroidota bacterium]